MSDEDRLTDDEGHEAEEEVSEVPTTFATKGVGWSGREEDGPQVIESDTPPAQPHTFRRSRPASG
jgi:hypothetical protein